MLERIQKILSARGACSRREAERLIADGRVTVNGVTASLGQSADGGTDVIALDGAPLRPPGERVYIMLNKPRGVVTTVRDDRGRQTAVSLVADCGARVYPVGRLDMDSDGLLLLTNDGAFANRLTHPSGEKEKTYLAEVSGDIDAALPVLSQPMEIDGYTVRPARVTADGGRLTFTIHEGRNRQIRKMCAQAGLAVRRLTRVSEGGVALGGLPPGAWRRLTAAEVEKLLGE
ncbi:MAG: rRNA pseudouridine synthase [Oscillospiraceae bacterium]|jgi:23S rRNA pseudouridine2605 synthase|nr:rRNA pseudouridine synthase [Oscillospiraceae bacterium]